MNKDKKYIPFNNSVEAGLRILSILNEAYPLSFDIQTLVYLDYLTVHSGDIDPQQQSLHPATPYRTGELYVRSAIIQKGLDLFHAKMLIDKEYSKEGIKYQASENSNEFIETLEETYFLKLNESAKWVIKRHSHFTLAQFRELIQGKLDKINNEFNIEILQ